MALPIPAYVLAAPWPGIYPGEGIQAIGDWVEAWAVAYLDSGQAQQDYEAWRIESQATFEAQLELLRLTDRPMDASVA